MSRTVPVEEAVVTADAGRSPQQPPVRIAEADGPHAVLVFSGAVDAPELPVLEEILLDPRLREATAWTLDMTDLDRIDLSCAYALLRTVTGTPAPVALTVRGARPSVHRILRQAGLDAVAAFTE